MKISWIILIIKFTTKLHRRDYISPRWPINSFQLLNHTRHLTTISIAKHILQFTYSNMFLFLLRRLWHTMLINGRGYLVRDTHTYLFWKNVPSILRSMRNGLFYSFQCCQVLRTDYHRLYYWNLSLSHFKKVTVFMLLRSFTRIIFCSLLKQKLSLRLLFG
jgi:hypothetical protein